MILIHDIFILPSPFTLNPLLPMGAIKFSHTLQEKESEIPMATLDSDVPMVPAGEPSSSAGPSSKKPKRFEIKKWNAVALWAWGIYSFTLLYC